MSKLEVFVFALPVFLAAAGWTVALQVRRMARRMDAREAALSRLKHGPAE